MGAERARYWLAGLSLVLASAAVAIVPVFAGLKSLAMLAIGVAAVAVSVVAGYLFLVIPVGIDGEAVRMQTPVTCTIRPGALRVRVPRDRPGATPPQPPQTWPGLWQLATRRNGGLR